MSVLILKLVRSYVFVSYLFNSEVSFSVVICYFRELLFKDSSHRGELRSSCQIWNADQFTSSSISTDRKTNRCIGLLIMSQPCLSHGTLKCRFFTRFPSLLMKTVSGFIHTKILKPTVISKVTSTVSILVLEIISQFHYFVCSF